MAFPNQTPQNDTALSSPSPEMFSFPGTPTEDNQSKQTAINELSSTSPADQFFLNGRLLPHDFPVQTTSSTRSSFSGRDQMTSISHTHSPSPNTVTLSRGTSGGSKEYSLVSSRSNSTNSSRGSTCSSISVEQKKTSSSSSHKRMNSLRNNSTSSISSPLRKYYKYGSSSSGSSQRWQFITAVPPVLGPSQSRRGRKENHGVGSTTSPRNGMMIIKNNNNNKDGGSNNNGTSFLYRMLRSVVATCKACHAMEGQDKEFELDPAGEVLGH